MEISLTSLKKNTLSFFSRYHVVIFAVIVIGGLAIAILMLNAIVISSGETTDYTPIGSNTTFDQETIDRVNQLKSRDETGTELTFPNGRINPFVE